MSLKRILLSLFAVPVLGALALTTSANATSVFDNAYKTTSTLSLSNSASGLRGACSATSYTTDWPSLFDQASNPYSSQQTTISNLKTSFQTALNNGRWGVSQFENSNYGYTGIHIYWTEDNSLSLTWVNEPYDIHIKPSGNVVKSISFVTQAAWFGNSNCEPYAQFALESFPPRISDEAGIYKNFFVYTNNPNYPPGYTEPLIPSTNTWADLDEDGLVAAQENIQGTSNSQKDTDGDGLDDLIESQWYGSRDDIFCGTSQCAYPDPLVKDVYIEADWMDDGTTEFKPSSTQIGLVEAAFSTKDINLHIDTGQYGGGNELPSYEENLFFMPTVGEADLYDFKNGTSTDPANFSEDRKGIWRYLIAGDKRDTDSSGAALAGDDDILVAIGRVVELNPLNQDQAIAGTIIHEIGHSLCLSKTSAYTGQDPGCVFASIDTEASSDYNSAMNYNKQFSLVNYSNGVNGSNDHDDWSAVMVGMDDFIGKVDETESSMLGSRRYIQQPED